MHRRRNILVILLGLGGLFVITIIGPNLESLLPQHTTAATQVVQAGPYQISLSVSPNPPHTSDPTKLTIQIVKKDAHQLVTNATVLLVNSMETMDMGTSQNQARLQNDGSYLAHLLFTMSGRWQVRVLVTVPSEQTLSATFEVTAQ
jgi:hypothetical protein